MEAWYGESKHKASNFRGAIYHLFLSDMLYLHSLYPLESSTTDDWDKIT